MIVPAPRERLGWWRGAGIAVGLLVVAAPALLLLRTLVSPTSVAPLGSGFLGALGRSLGIAAGAAAVALALGFPSGLVAGLYRFPVKRLLLAALAVPLLIPSFLWAIGLSMFRIELGLPRDSILSGAGGTILAFAALGIPLVAFTTLVAIRLLPANALDAARIAGGELAVARNVGRAVVPAALAAALVAGLVSIADPGPGQILGFSAAATQILVSFSALYDFELAARQGLIAAAIALVAAAPLILMISRRAGVALLPRETRLASPQAQRVAAWLSPLVLAAALTMGLFAPLAGLLAPIVKSFEFTSVLTAVGRTGASTLLYALGAGLVATVCALPLAVSAGRSEKLRNAVLGALILIAVLPPAVGALGVVQLAGEASPWLDPLLRSRFTVAAVLGLRLTAIAAIVLLRAIGSTSKSWAAAAAVHGVPPLTYARRVLAPFFAGPIFTSIGLVALVAAADVTTVLLLAPPGRDSLALAIFTVMANAPESVVASLCLAYVSLGAVIVAALTVAFGARDNGARRG
jgi:iron(III) transport system permease protein